MRKNLHAEILRIAEAVAAIRGVDSARLFSRVRGSEKVASARTFTMAACLAGGIPLGHVARAFSKPWSAVYNAEKSCDRRLRNSARFADEWQCVIAPAQPTRELAEISEA